MSMFTQIGAISVGACALVFMVLSAKEEQANAELFARYATTCAILAVMLALL